MCEHPQTCAEREFTKTHWSQVQAARTSSPEHRRAVLDNLARRYWKPVYHYLRANGCQDAEARDITQDFFVDVILGRDLFAQADRQRGRFRPFLLHSLKNFVRDRHRRQRTARRSPTRPVVSLDQWADSQSTRFEPPAPDTSPDELFHRKWVASLLEEVLDRLRRSCEISGLDVHFEIFRQRFTRPALEGAEQVPLEELARQHSLTTKQVANRCETIRRRFRKLLLGEVRLTVMDDKAAEDELRSLMGHLRPKRG